MHEKYDFDSIRCSVKKTISISMIVTSVICLLSKNHQLSLVRLLCTKRSNSRSPQTVAD